MSKKSTNDSVSAEELQPPMQDSSEQLKNLEEDIKILKEKNDELEDKNTRLVAELHNLGNRLRREFDTKKEYAISNFAKEILDGLIQEWLLIKHHHNSIQE